MTDQRKDKPAVPKRKLAMAGAAIAVVAASSLIVLPALATPGSGFTRAIVSQGLFGELQVKAEKTDKWDLMLKTKGATDIGVDRLTVIPGGQSGWHSHAGPTLVTVTVGQIAWIDAATCTVRTYHAGDGFVEPAGGVHLVRNTTTATAEFVAIQMRPQGAEGRIDAPQPSNCNA